MLDDALRSRKAHILLAVAGCYLAWQLWLTIAAPHKIANFAETAPEKVNILVTLPFPPERFHVQLIPDLRQGIWNTRKMPLKFGE